MKKLTLISSAVLLVLLSVNLNAGQTLRSLGNLDPGVTQINSSAFGKSLDAWMEEYIRWLERGADPSDQIRNVAFLPILGESPFNVEVKPGTALVLPVVTWLGYPGEEALPNEWWGDPNHIFGNVTLDGQAIVVPNEDYYVGPTDLDPNAILFGVYEIDFYQALVVVINPLPHGNHVIVLDSAFVDFGEYFHNEWNITVVSPGKN